jgi:excisionase family DNA binding protein
MVFPACLPTYSATCQTCQTCQTAALLKANARLSVVFFAFSAYHLGVTTSTDILDGAANDLITTGEAAKLLGTSRQHVVDLCDRGDLPCRTVGTHRRVSRADLEELSARTQRLTRDQLRSLWLGNAVAGKLVRHPDRVLDLAHRNLAHLQVVHTRGQGARWLAQWDIILRGPIDVVLETLTSRTPRARELRQNSPFAGVLTETERAEVLGAFQRAGGSGRR